MDGARLCLALVALNIADLLLTLLGLELGAREANPLLAAAWRRGVVSFVGVKVALASVALAIFWRWRERERMRLLMLACIFVYSGVMVVHVRVLSALT